MQNRTHLPTWLIGGTLTWLAYALTLSTLHLWLLNQWGVPFTIRLYSLDAASQPSLPHILLLGMVSPGFFILDALAFLRIHLPWVDGAIYNWRTMVFLSSLPAFWVGALLLMRDRRTTLAGSILALLLLGGGLLFILSIVLAQ